MQPFSTPWKHQKTNELIANCMSAILITQVVQFQLFVPKLILVAHQSNGAGQLLGTMWAKLHDGILKFPFVQCIYHDNLQIAKLYLKLLLLVHHSHSV